jgi:hypothetical protein
MKPRPRCIASRASKKRPKPWATSWLNCRQPRKCYLEDAAPMLLQMAVECATPAIVVASAQTGKVWLSRLGLDTCGADYIFSVFLDCC